MGNNNLQAAILLFRQPLCIRPDLVAIDRIFHKHFGIRIVHCYRPKGVNRRLGNKIDSVGILAGKRVVILVIVTNRVNSFFFP